MLYTLLYNEQRKTRVLIGQAECVIRVYKYNALNAARAVKKPGTLLRRNKEGKICGPNTTIEIQ